MKNTLNIFVKLFLGYLGFTTILFAQNSLPPPGALFPKSNVDQRSAMPINQDRRYWEREFLEGSPQSARKLPIKNQDIIDSYLRVKDLEINNSDLLNKKKQLLNYYQQNYNLKIESKVQDISRAFVSSSKRTINPQGEVQLIIKGSPIASNEKVTWLDYSPSGNMLAFPLGLGAQIYNLHKNQFGRDEFISLADEDWLSIFQTNNLSVSNNPNLISNRIFSDINSNFNRSQNNIIPNQNKNSELVYPINPELAAALSSVDLDKSPQISSLAIGNPLLGHQNLIYDLAYYPDSSRIVSGGGDGYVRVWDFSTNRQIGRPIEGHSGLIYAVAVSPDATLLASAGNDGGIRLWNAYSGSQVLPPITGYQGDIYSLHFSNDSKRLYSGGADGKINIWDVNTGVKINTLEGHHKAIYAIDISNNGKYLASAGADNQINIWQLGNYQKIQNITNIEGNIYALAFDPKSEILASTGSNSHVFLWNVADGKPMKESLYTNGYPMFSLAISPDSQQIAAGGYDKVIWIWDELGDKPNPASPVKGHNGWISSIAYDHSGTYLISASSDNSIRFWRAPAKPTSNALISPESEKKLSLANEYRKNTTTNYANKINQIFKSSAVFARSHDGAYWAIASDNKIEQYIAKTNKLRKSITINRKKIDSNWSAITYSPNDNVIAAGNYQGQFAVFSAISGKLLSYLPINKSNKPVKVLALSQNEQWLASADDQGDIKIYRNLYYQSLDKPKQNNTWSLQYQLTAHQGRVLSMAFVGDKILISGGEDQQLFVYNMQTGNNLGRSYQGQFSPITSIAVAKSNQEIATGGLDGSIQRWQIHVHKQQGDNFDQESLPVARVELFPTNSDVQDLKIPNVKDSKNIPKPNDNNQNPKPLKERFNLPEHISLNPLNN